MYPSLIRLDAEEMIALSLPLPHRGAFIQVSGEGGLYAGGGGAPQAVYRASTCEIKPQCFQHHSPFFTSFPSSPSFPRLPCVTPSYSEERQPARRTVKLDAAQQHRSAFKIKARPRAEILIRRAALHTDRIKIQHAITTSCCETERILENSSGWFEP